jgi:hypothetical protein
MFGQTKWNCASPSRADCANWERTRSAISSRTVLVRVDVVRGAEALVRDRAVVALEVVLAGDLPVRGELGVVAHVEDEVVDRDEVGDRAERVRERQRVLVRVHEQERPPRLEPHLTRDRPSLSKARLAVRARAARSDPSRSYVHAWYGHCTDFPLPSPSTRATLGGGRR